MPGVLTSFQNNLSHGNVDNGYANIADVSNSEVLHGTSTCSNGPKLSELPLGRLVVWSLH